MSDNEPTSAHHQDTPASPTGHRSSHARRNIFAVTVFMLVVVLFTFTFRLAVVRGDSMLPTYKDGQVVLVNKIGAMRRPLSRGDVVLVEHARDVLIKRIAYLPGDVIPAAETWRFRRVSEFFDLQQPGPGEPPFPRLKVPPGYVVVLGDNRRESEDSRLIGPVKKDEIIGRVVGAPPRQQP